MTGGRCPEHLKEDLSDHFQDCVRFSATLLQWVASHLPQKVAESLSMPLEEMIQESAQSMLRVLHYPPVPDGSALPRAAAHEDINLLTILPASDGPGLELQLQNGKWIEVVNRPSQGRRKHRRYAPGSNGWLPAFDDPPRCCHQGGRSAPRTNVLATFSTSPSRCRLVRPIYCKRVSSAETQRARCYLGRLSAC
jgi:hypothetical protein